MAPRRGTPLDLARTSPRVRFAADFPRRLESFTSQFVAARERRGGARAGRATGEGAEFVGYRPYREGEDPRRIDWNLLARLDRPFVRVTRREIGGDWLVLVDASASMSLGLPGKLQRAAESAAAIACVGLRAGARVRVLVSNEIERRIQLARLAELPALLETLESIEARGRDGLGVLVARARLERASALFAIGDGFDVEPEAWTSLATAWRTLGASFVLADHELAPPSSGSVRWIDPESGDALELELESEVRERYLELLEARLERWRVASARVGASFFVGASASSFEDFARGALGG